jgi:HPt (histidine-containing phosphotransfer) domain-containing protein
MDMLKLLNTSSALNMLDGKKTLYAELIDSYLDEMAFDSTRLESLISAGNLTDAGNYIHRCKGASAQLGAEQLAAAAQIFEDVLKGKKQGDLAALKKDFLLCYEETTAALRKYRIQL